MNSWPLWLLIAIAFWRFASPSQYYEFAAVDRPLTPQQQAELRSRSSRATITSGSFINEYRWREIDGLLKRGSGAAYDQALHLTQVLSEALSHTGRGSEFRSGIVTLLAKHGTRRAWITRLEKAGLWWMPRP